MVLTEGACGQRVDSKSERFQLRFNAPIGKKTEVLKKNPTTVKA